MSKNKLNGLSRVERKPLIYDPITKKCYNGEMYFKATHKEINAWSVTNSFKSEYIPIKCPDEKTLEEGYAEFVKQADKLKEQSKGRLNLYLSGTLKKASLALFFYMANAKGYVPEELTEMETEWFINCNHGQLVFVDPMYKDRKSHSYDINSMYPSLMRDQHFKIPMKQGTFTTLTQDAFEKLAFFQYGIYRVKIDPPPEFVPDECEMTKEEYKMYYKYNATRRTFRFNKNNYYTSTDLNVAKKLELKMTIIEDESPNFLAYGAGTTLTGSQVFKMFVDNMFKLRTETKNKDFKTILNILWGALCSSNLKTFQYDITKELTFDIDIDPEKYIISNQYFVRNNIFKIEYYKKNNYFNYAWIRMKPFLLAFGRQKLGRVMTPYITNIVSVNTDGFKTYSKIEIEVGEAIGDVRYEGLVEESRFKN